jgi:hypothetical protein
MRNTRKNAVLQQTKKRKEKNPLNDIFLIFNAFSLFVSHWLTPDSPFSLTG